MIDALSSLVAKSMLVADRTPSGSTRYQMLETMRQYAREQLDAAALPTRAGAATPGTTPTSSAEPGPRYAVPGPAREATTTCSGGPACGSKSTTCGPRCCGHST